MGDNLPLALFPARTPECTRGLNTVLLPCADSSVEENPLNLCKPSSVGNAPFTMLALQLGRRCSVDVWKPEADCSGRLQDVLSRAV